MTERGVFRSQDNARQLIKFDGMRWGRITPTDVDGFIDFGNRLFVFIEVKYGEAQMPNGQKLALERLCDACHNPPHLYAVAFVASHRSHGDVELADTAVTQYRWNGKWCDPQKPGSKLVDGIEAFRSRIMKNIITFTPKPNDEWLEEYEKAEHC